MVIRLLLLFSALNGLALSMKFAEKCCGKGMHLGTVGVHTQDGFSCGVTNKVFASMEKELMLKSHMEKLMCKGFYKQCCITAAKVQYCVLGMSFGKANQMCLSGSNKMAGKAQQTCCDCCKSGRDAGSKRADCESASFNDHLCTHSYKQCCKEIKDKLPVDPVKEKKKTCKDVKCNIKSTESCTETSKGPQCICKDGYIGLNDGITCIDINECESGEKKCHGKSKCVNKPGSFECMCDKGFVYNETTKACVESKMDCEKGYHKVNGKCMDIDECKTSANKCPSHMFCINLNGTHDCLVSCNYPRYEYVRYHDKNICKDVNECLNPNKCDKDTQECINHIGGHTCKLVRCPNGYKLVNGFCQDDNECEDADICGKFGACRNALGSYYCDCKKGYHYNTDTRKCEDVDECKLGRHRCSFKCVNTPGSYHCICPAGYEARGQHQAFCYDINECATQKPCAATEYCFNTYGSYRCINETCPKPYYIRSSSNACKRMHCYHDQECMKNKVNTYRWAYYKLQRDVPIGNFKFRYSLTGFGHRFRFSFKLIRGNFNHDFMIEHLSRDRIQVRNVKKIKGPRFYPLVLQSDAILDGKLFMRFVYYLNIDVSKYNYL